MKALHSLKSKSKIKSNQGEQYSVYGCFQYFNDFNELFTIQTITKMFFNNKLNSAIINLILSVLGFWIYANINAIETENAIEKANALRLGSKFVKQKHVFQI